MFRLFDQYVSIKCLVLVTVECTLIVLSLLLAIKLRFWNSVAEYSISIIYPEFALQSAAIVLVCISCLYCNDMYDLSADQARMDKLLRVEQSLGAASVVLGLLYFLIPQLLLGRGVFLIGMFLAAASVSVTRTVLDGFWSRTAPLQRVAILGTGRMAMDLARELGRRSDLSLQLAGFVSGKVELCDGESLLGLPVLGVARDVESIVRLKGLSRIIVALEDRRGVLPTRELVSLRVSGIRVDDAVTAFAALTGRVPLATLNPGWLVFSEGFRRSAWNESLKRIVDMVGAIVGIVLTWPVMLIVGIAVRLESRGSVIYRQTRVGWMGKPFTVLKFRSMRADAESKNGAQWATFNDPRVTRLGGMLRKYRLDELPQFFNVLLGEMSFVGPRPERPYFVEQLRQTIPYYDERHSVRPGLTGWAQVQYRYGSTEEDAFKKLEYDLFYLKNLSLSFDVAIIFQTIRIVVGGRGA
jgi:sugar transferase (PEP-CTERM system associated)